MMTTTPEFDAAAIISKDVVTPMLTAAAADPDPQKFISTISQLARVIGVAEVANRAGIGSVPSLYRSLSAGHEPRWSTIVKCLDAMGYRIVIEPKPPRASMSTKKSRPVRARSKAADDGTRSRSPAAP